MEQFDVIKWLVSKLENAGINYFITGSIASTYHGIPRFTHDIDIVVTLKKNDIDSILNLFKNDGYISREGVGKAFQGTGMFNFIHDRTGMKIDFWLDRGEPFTKSCFARTQKITISEGFMAVMASPEDVLLHKVYWNKLTPSERQIRDAQGIITIQGARLDIAYIKSWADSLDIRQEIEALFATQEMPNRA